MAGPESKIVDVHDGYVSLKKKIKRGNIFSLAVREREKKTTLEM